MTYTGADNRPANPLRLLVAITWLCLLLVAVLDNDPLRIKFPDTGPGGVVMPSAENVIGPRDFIVDWTIATETLGSGVLDTALDSTNGHLYAAGSDGVIYGCDTDSDCDEDGDWFSVFDTGESEVQAVEYDSVHSILYAGASPSVFRCDPGAGDCLGGTGWTEVFDTSAVNPIHSVRSLFVDTVNGAVYVGSNGNVLSPANIFRCDTSTACDDPAEWLSTGALDANTHILDFTMDTALGFLYASGYDPQTAHIALVLQCDTTTDCDSSGDWVLIFYVGDNVTHEEFLSVVYDGTNGQIFAGSLTGLLFRCETAADCSDSDNWVQVASVVGGLVGGPALIWDEDDNTLYSSGNKLYRCDAASVCDGPSDWAAVFEGAPESFVIDTAHDVIYAGFGTSPTIIRCEIATGCDETELFGSTGSAYDGAGGAQRLFVSDAEHHRVLVYDLSDGISDGEAPVNVLGQPDFSTDNCDGQGGADQDEFTLCGARDVAYDPSNQRLFVTDSDNARVLVFDLSDGLDDGEAAVNVLGQENFVDDATVTDRDSMAGTTGVEYDDINQRLFVADGSSRTMVFDVDPSVLVPNDPGSDGPDAINVLGQPDFITSGCNTTQTGLCDPSQIALDSVGNRLFVADQSNNRVMVFVVDPAVLVPDCGLACDGPDAINVLGQPNFTTADAQTDDSSLSGPQGVGYDSTDGRLFVGDSSNNRVMVWDVDAIINGEPAEDVVGQNDFDTNDSGTTAELFLGPGFVDFNATARLFVADSGNNRVMVFGLAGAPTPTPTPTPTPGGGGSNQNPPQGIGFTPDRIVVNQDESVTDSRNVLVTVYAINTDNFTGTVDVLLSNDPLFSTFVPFRYNIPESREGRSVQYIWPKTIAWDLCFGQRKESPCDPGRKTVYARFYVNIPAARPALTPTP